MERIRPVIAKHVLAFTRQTPGCQAAFNRSCHKGRPALIGTDDEQMGFDEFFDILTGTKISCGLPVIDQATKPIASIMGTSLKHFQASFGWMNPQTDRRESAAVSGMFSAATRVT